MREFEELFNRADAAGRAAAVAVTPVPMTVAEADVFGGPKPGGKVWHVPDGVCGFGWVHLKGNTAFGKWAKKTGKARPDYPAGLRISSPLMTQSLARNEAYAYAFAEVLCKAGVKAYGNSRID